MQNAQTNSEYRIKDPATGNRKPVTVSLKDDVSIILTLQTKPLKL
jgi:hypothetical protein